MLCCASLMDLLKASQSGLFDSPLVKPCHVLFSWPACYPSFVRYPEHRVFPTQVVPKRKGKRNGKQTVLPQTTNPKTSTRRPTSMRKSLNNQPRTPMPQMLKLLSGQLVNRTTTNTTASTARIPHFFRTAVPVDVGAADAGPEGEVGDPVIRGEERGLCELFFFFLLVFFFS